MRVQLWTTLVVALGLLGLGGPGALAADKAKIVTIEGATTTYQVRGMHGQLVTVEVPSQTLADVEVATPGQPGTPGAGGTVQATVVAIDGETNRVKVRTQEGQTITLEMSPTALKDRRLGETFTLEVPKR